MFSQWLILIGIQPFRQNEGWVQLPNRIFKDSICTSNEVDELSWFEEVLFYRLIVNCDDFGRFDGRFAIVKGKLFPLKKSLTEATIEKALDRLATVGLVIPYLCDGKPYLQLVTWDKHQQRRAKSSKYPPMPNETCNHMISDDINCNQMPPNSKANTKTNTASAQNADGSSGQKQKKPIYDTDSKYYKAAAWLRDDILEKQPTHRSITEANLQSWADEFRKLEQLDNVEWGNIRAVLLFAREDTFWQSNILSGKTFREKFDQLSAKKQAQKYSTEDSTASMYDVPLFGEGEGLVDNE